jgi:transcriptional regulator with XRE-family HTH domain
MSLGMEIKLQRTRSGVSQKTLAKLFGTTQVHLSWWENGTHRPIAKNLKKINEFLSMSPEALIAFRLKHGISKVAAKPEKRRKLKKGTPK